MHVTLLIQFLDLRGNCGLQTASEVKSDLEFEISDLNYPCIHVHVTLLIPLFISPRPLRPPNNLGGQIWPQIWNQWPKEPMWPKFQGTFVSHFRNFSRLKSACSWPALALQVITNSRQIWHSTVYVELKLHKAEYLLVNPWTMSLRVDLVWSVDFVPGQQGTIV